MDIKIKNNKPDKEKVIPNAGVETGPKASEYKFNTMNLPIMGSNFQVSIGAKKEKTFKDVSSIQAYYMQSAANIINEGANNSEEEYIPQHYVWDVKINESTGNLYLDPEPTGVILNPTDTVTLTTSVFGTPMSFEVTIEETTDTVVIQPYLSNVDISEMFTEISQNSSFGYAVMESSHIQIPTYLAPSTVQNHSVGLYNGNNGIEIVLFYFYSIDDEYSTGNIELFYNSGNERELNAGSIRAISSLSTISHANLDDGNGKPGAIDYEYKYLEDKGYLSYYVFNNSHPVFSCADRNITIDMSSSSTYTIQEGEYYYYIENWLIGNGGDYTKHIDLYIIGDSQLSAGTVMRTDT